jgi:anti-anti-sigma factor
METRSTIVVKLPEDLTRKAVRVAMRQLRPGLRLDHPHIVVDLSNVRRMDSAAIDMLLHCVVEVARRDGELKLAGLSAEAATVLELTRMDRIFEIFPSVPDAVGTSGYEVSQLETLPAPAESSQQPAAA